ncbi:hypothetical protein [Glycomyces harbinensis]|uniref:Uncharacterized protein n=1 Tax=Glycomyces harbinensis TaxID=58114 RepID=A0A1G6RPE3_9ACTN|nr:hypothetical protein [Glycomyces harbinensis]SDD06301.1 hypothetical protein SAMN05216270_101584 [Glycomyces harbinensis]
MSYNQPPHYNFGQPEQPQQPQSVPPSYSSQPPPQPPMETGYVPQQTSPVQGYPGAPQPTYGTQVLPTPPPVPRRSPLIPILAVAMVISLAGAVLSLALWLRSSGDLDDAESKLTDRDDEIAQLQEDVEAAQAEADENATLAADAESMRACLDDLKAYYAAPIGSDEEATAEAALQESCQTWVF